MKPTISIYFGTVGYWKRSTRTHIKNRFSVTIPLKYATVLGGF